jgi:hypothetical protein
MEYGWRARIDAYAELRNKIGMEFRGSVAHLAFENESFTSLHKIHTGSPAHGS